MNANTPPCLLSQPSPPVLLAQVARCGGAWLGGNESFWSLWICGLARSRDLRRSATTGPPSLAPFSTSGHDLDLFFWFCVWILAFWFHVCVQIVIIGWLRALCSVLRFSLDLCSVLCLCLGSGRIVCVSIVFVGWLRECAAVAHAVD